MKGAGAMQGARVVAPGTTLSRQRSGRGVVGWSRRRQLAALMAQKPRGSVGHAVGGVCVWGGAGAGSDTVRV